MYLAGAKGGTKDEGDGVVFLARKELGGHACIAVESPIPSTVPPAMPFAISSDINGLQIISVPTYSCVANR